MKLHTSLRGRMELMIGTSIGISLSGMVVILGISSILLLSSKRDSLSRQDNLLRIYTIVLLFLGVALQVQALFYVNFSIVLLFQSVDKGNEILAISDKVFNATLVLVISLTDSLLVWRCFMVQTVLSHNSSKWSNILWFFPAGLWAITFAMGIATTVLNQTAWFSTLATSAFAGNLVLNLYATLFISIRLLLHRRMVLACMRDKALATQHIYIVGIFLESAAINLPIVTVAAVGAGTGRITLERTMLPIVAASQVFASVIIIHQAALGRIFSRQREDGIKKLMETRERSISENLQSAA